MNDIMLLCVLNSVTCPGLCDWTTSTYLAAFYFRSTITTLILFVSPARLLVTSPKVHWSEGSLVRKVTDPNSNPNPYHNPNPNRNPIPNP